MERHQATRLIRHLCPCDYRFKARLWAVRRVAKQPDDAPAGRRGDDIPEGPWLPLLAHGFSRHCQSRMMEQTCSDLRYPGNRASSRVLARYGPGGRQVRSECRLASTKAWNMVFATGVRDPRGLGSVQRAPRLRGAQIPDLAARWQRLHKRPS